MQPPADREHLLEDLNILKPRNSAGRDLPAAIAMGVLLGAAVIASLVYAKVAWYPFVAAACALAMWEVVQRLRVKDWQVPRTVLIIGGQLMIWLTIPWHLAGLVIGLTITVFFTFVHRLFLHGNQEAPRNWLRDCSVAMFILLWIPLPVSLAAMLSSMENPWGVNPSWVILTFMFGVVANDIGGYMAGVFFGKHPMAPAVSPKKSWEGFGGSLLLGGVVGILSAIFLLQAPWWQGLVLGLLLVIAGTLGDLVESQFKRDLGIKDMSNMIPGHGGLMDRMDGILPSAAMTWVMLQVLLLT